MLDAAPHWNRVTRAPGPATGVLGHVCRALFVSRNPRPGSAVAPLGDGPYRECRVEPLQRIAEQHGFQTVPPPGPVGQQHVYERQQALHDEARLVQVGLRALQGVLQPGRRGGPYPRDQRRVVQSARPVERLGVGPRVAHPVAQHGPEQAHGNGLRACPVLAPESSSTAVSGGEVPHGQCPGQVLNELCQLVRRVRRSFQGTLRPARSRHFYPRMSTGIVVVHVVRLG
ncbi:hypothetical protein [Streptomyces sp. NPDC050504]|uniref:hypothetical protein n=1 Tax=Streptomyces sp. NPDC050504 TaxID=3365618 RepID=UPI0037A7C62F